MKFVHRFQRTSAVSFKPRTRRHLGLTRSLFVHTVNCPLDRHLRYRPWLSVSERCLVERTSRYRNTNNFTAEPFSQWIHDACTKQLKLEYCTLEKLNYVVTVKWYVHYKQTNTASWSKTVTVHILRTGALLLSCRATKILFWSIFHCIKHFPVVRWWFQECPLSVLERCSSYREYSYSKMTEKQQGPKTGVRLNVLYRCLSYIGVRFTEVSVL